MFRVILYVALLILFARALSRLWGGVREGLGASRSTRPRAVTQGVQMERDPICGTFVVPTSALRLHDGSRVHYFCSTRCRDEYQARPDHVRGRTA